MRISDILKAKGSEVVSLPGDATVGDLVTLLNERGIGAVVVKSENSPVAGIVSERDVVRGLARNPDILSRSITEIMTGDVVTVEPGQLVHDLARLMTDRRIRHVPVCADDELVGIVSIGDVVKNRIDELQFERDQLETYVST